jgi:hypothetical protein
MRDVMTKAIKISSIGLFVLIIVTPTIQKELNLLPVQPLQENRLKKEPPSDWRVLFETGSVFARQFEDYFNDHYGLRDLLIRTKNQIDYSVFHKSEKIIIGRDGWLFYKSVVEEEEIGAEKMSAVDLDQIYNRVLKLSRILSSRGITLVTLVSPMKNSIYPEMLPVSAPRRPSPTSFERFLAFLHAHPEITTVDTFPLLKKLKETMQVYYKMDFHWTDAAGAYAARDLIQKLGSLSGKENLWEKPIQVVSKRGQAGGESQALGLLWQAYEEAPYPSGPRLDLRAGIYAQGQNSNEWTYTTKLSDTAGLIPDTVMFGDSYADAFLRAGFTSYFAHFQKYSIWDFAQKFKNVPDGTRFLIFELLEPINFLTALPFWPEELRANGDTLSAEVSR